MMKDNYGTMKVIPRSIKYASSSTCFSAVSHVSQIETVVNI